MQRRRYLADIWLPCGGSNWRPPTRFGRNIGYHLDDKAVFPPANYHLLRRYRTPVRGHHLRSGDNYAALIFNWVVYA